MGMLRMIKAAPMVLIFSFLFSLPCFSGESYYSYGAGKERIDGAGTIHYYVNDHLGSARVILKEDQTVEWTSDYQPYGREVNVQGAGEDKTFSGKEHDGTGLYYFGARYYDPVVGRFTTPDKAYQFASRYVYAGNSPLMRIDPDGNEDILYHGTSLGALKSWELYGGVITGTISQMDHYDSYSYTLFLGDIETAFGRIEVTMGALRNSGVITDQGVLKSELIYNAAKSVLGKSTPPRSDFDILVVVAWKKGSLLKAAEGNIIKPLAEGTVYRIGGYQQMPLPDYYQIGSREDLRVRAMDNLVPFKPSRNPLKRVRAKLAKMGYNLLSEAKLGMAVNVVGDAIDTAMLMNDPRPYLPISELPGYFDFGLPTVYSLGNAFWSGVGVTAGNAYNAVVYGERPKSPGWWYNRMSANDPWVPHPLK